MKIHFITDCINNRLKYILKQFLSFTVLDIELVVRQPLSPDESGGKNIYYLKDLRNAMQAQGIFIHNCADSRISPVRRQGCNYKGRDFFVWEEYSKGKSEITGSEGKVFVNFDLFAQAFYQLACCREYALEAEGINPHSNARSICDTAEFEEPNVNTLFLILEGLITEKFGVECVKEKRYPAGKQFAVVLTHDIDILRKSPKDRVKHIWHGCNRAAKLSRKGEFAAIPRELLATFAKVCGREEYNNIGYLEGLEEKNNVRSSFNVFVGNKNNKTGLSNWLYNPDYDILNDATFTQKLRQLADRGFEIGIHGSLSSGGCASLFAQELRDLEAAVQRKILGGRQHFLDYSAAGTPEVFNSSGIEYDTSVGFRDINGFRAGACLPHYLYSFAADNATGVLEIPLLIMDGVLFDRGAGTKENAWQSAKAILEKVKRAEGCCSVVWHQRVFNNRDYPFWEDVYLMLIAWVKDNNGALLKPGELNRFWKDKPAALQGG